MLILTSLAIYIYIYRMLILTSLATFQCLHVRLAERSKFSEGEIQTFMSVDADRTVNLCNSFHDIWRSYFYAFVYIGWYVSVIYSCYHKHCTAVACLHFWWSCIICQTFLQGNWKSFAHIKTFIEPFFLMVFLNRFNQFWSNEKILKNFLLLSAA